MEKFILSLLCKYLRSVGSIKTYDTIFKVLKFVKVVK